MDAAEQVLLRDGNHYVGKLHAGRLVYVMLDPHRREWLFTDERGQ